MDRKMIKAVMIKPYGEFQYLTIRNDLKDIQRLVNGYVELVHLKDSRYILAVNEESRLLGEEYCVTAETNYGMKDLSGTVLLFGNGDSELIDVGDDTIAITLCGGRFYLNISAPDIR